MKSVHGFLLKTCYTSANWTITEARKSKEKPNHAVWLWMSGPPKSILLVLRSLPIAAWHGSFNFEEAVKVSTVHTICERMKDWRFLVLIMGTYYRYPYEAFVKPCLNLISCLWRHSYLHCNYKSPKKILPKIGVISYDCLQNHSVTCNFFAIFKTCNILYYLCEFKKILYCSIALKKNGLRQITRTLL